MKTIKETMGVVVGSLGIVLYPLLGTATCTWCLGAIFGFLGVGAGGVIFILNHKIYVLLISLGFLAVSFYFLYKKAKCDDCHV
jgi:hypothetical protein